MTPFSFPKSNFRVEWNGADIRFQEVTGLGVSLPPDDVPEGGLNRLFKKIKGLHLKIPGLFKKTNIILKRGVFRGNPPSFYNWRKAVERPTGQKTDIRLLLLNEKQELVKTWRLERAWPVKIVASDLKADANEVAIESVELTCEGVKLE